MKKTETSFLEKFSGKMSKMGKQGITGLLDSSCVFNVQHISSTADQSKRRPSILRNKQTAHLPPSRQKQSLLDDLDILIPSNPLFKVRRHQVQLFPKHVIVQNRRSHVRSNYIPSFTTDQSKRIQQLYPLKNQQNYRRQHNTLDLPSFSRQRHLKTRESIISSKTKDYLKSNPIINNQDRKNVSHTNNQLIMGYSQKMTDDILKHLSYLNSLDKKLTIGS